jgi:acyl carrier protein
MTREEIKILVVSELSRIAPETDPSALSETADLREELDIDSMDFLNFITALHARLGTPIPEADYAKLFTIGGAITYLLAKLQR